MGRCEVVRLKVSRSSGATETSSSSGNPDSRMTSAVMSLVSEAIERGSWMDRP